MTLCMKACMSTEMQLPCLTVDPPWELDSGVPADCYYFLLARHIYRMRQCTGKSLPQFMSASSVARSCQGSSISAFDVLPRPPACRTVQALTGGDSQLSVESVILPDGEDFKTLDDVSRVWDKVGAGLAGGLGAGCMHLLDGCASQARA